MSHQDSQAGGPAGPQQPAKMPQSPNESPPDDRGALTPLIHAPFPLIVYAENGQVIHVNDVWTELSGYGLDDIPTLDAWFAKAQRNATGVTPEDIDALYESNQRVEEGEHTITTRSGGELIWDFTSAPMGRLADGRRAVLRMAADVTERKQLEKSLWEANRRMINIVESISDGFVALDREGRFAYINERAKQIIERPLEDLLGCVIWDAVPGNGGTGHPRQGRTSSP